MVNKFFTIEGVPMSGAEIRSALLGSFQEEVERTVESVQKDTEKLLENLQKNTSNRGVGRHASRYNNPFANATVEVQRKSGEFRVRVNHPFFYYLDKGRPGATANTKPMRFPRYRGNLTSPHSLTMNSPVSLVRDSKGKVEWVTVKSGESVGPVDPREFYKTIVDKRTYLRPPARERRTRNPFRFRLSAAEVEVTVIDE